MINAFKRGLITNKMSFKFAANIGMMFKEAGDIDKRYEAAKNAGFSAVECAFPYSIPAEQLVKSKEAAGICQALINTYPGNLEAGDLGMASIPHRKKDFEDSLNLSITYAKALNCKRIHIMSGKEPGFKDAAMDDCYVTNLKYAAERLEKEGITALIEPINTRLTAPRYFLNTLPKALDCIKKVNHPNLKLQLDIFHLQILHGNLTYMLEEYLPFTDYIQIAQAPNRDEPNALGEINYVYIFELLKNAGYSGYIGLEYNPKGNIEAGDFGMAALPHRKKDFEDSLTLSITYAKALNCKRIQIMSGKESGFKDAAMDDCYVTNLKYAAERLEKLKKVNHPNLKLQLDIFHLQLLHGNLTYMLEEYLPFTGDTVEGLKWMQQFGLKP